LGCHAVAVHIYTQTIHRTTQLTINVEECAPCPVFASFTLAFALRLRKKHRKTSVRLRKTSVRVQFTYYQNTHTNTHITIPKHTHTHTHTLQNNIEPPQIYYMIRSEFSYEVRSRQQRISFYTGWSVIKQRAHVLSHKTLGA